MNKNLFLASFLYLSTTCAFAANLVATHEGYVTTATEVTNIKHSPDAIVLDDMSNHDELVVFYRYSDDQKSGFSVASDINSDSSLKWTGNGKFTDLDAFKTSSIAPAPIQFNNKLYLFGIKKDKRDIIYNSFSNVEDLLASHWDNDKYLQTGKEASSIEGRDTISLVNYGSDIMMSFYAYPQPTNPEFSYARCNNALTCIGGNNKSGADYTDPTLITSVVNSDGKTRTLLFVRDDNDHVIHLQEYKQWPNETQPRFGYLYTLSNSLEHVSGAVLSSVQVDDTLYLYFKNEKGAISEMDISVADLDNKSWSYPVEVKGVDGSSITNIQGGPKAVMYHDHMYVFYVDKNELKVKYFVV